MPPTEATAQAYSTSLAAIWNATADPTSTTGSATLASVLDPDATGSLTHDGFAIAPWTFEASPPITDALMPVWLTWNAPSAASCIASGGVPGDGWGGIVATHGQQDVVQHDALVAVYELTCSHPNGWSSRKSIEVRWLPADRFGYVRLEGSPRSWFGAPSTVSWVASMSPCTLSGHIERPLTGLPATGTTSITFNRLGEVQLHLSCDGIELSGLGTDTLEPRIDLKPNATDRRIGQQFRIFWDVPDDVACTPSGGAPGDGWSLAQLQGNSHSPVVTSPGTYTYRLTCTSGPVAVAEEVSARFSHDAPYAALTTSSRTILAFGDPIVVTWRSNVDDCYLIWPENASGSQWIPPEGSLHLHAAGPAGTRLLSIQCGSGDTAASSEPVEIRVVDTKPPPPTVSLSTTAAEIDIGQPFTLQWTSWNAQSCSASSSDGSWSGPLATSGSATLSLPDAGSRIFSVTCSGEFESATSEVSVHAKVATPSPTQPPSSNSGGGGGGAIDWMSLLGLLLPLGARRMHRPRDEGRRVSGAGAAFPRKRHYVNTF